jgi:hypothetical protein
MLASLSVVGLSLVGTWRGKKAAVATRTGDSKGAACGVHFTLEGTGDATKAAA